MNHFIILVTKRFTIQADDMECALNVWNAGQYDTHELARRSIVCEETGEEQNF